MPSEHSIARNGNFKTLTVAVLWLMSLATIGGCVSDDAANATRVTIPERYQGISDKPFDEVMADLEIAISEHNFRKVNETRISDVIRSRGKPDYPNTTIVYFCNVNFAERILAVSKDYLLYLPCRTAVYEKGDKVVVETQLLPDDPRLRPVNQEVNNIMRKIVDFAVN